MRSTYSFGAAMKLQELRDALKNNQIKDYYDFKETPIGSGNVSYKFVPHKIERIHFTGELKFNFSEV